ncbi:MAG: hypothetical protein FJ102_20905 [Deltaproteobacteria bacterium]|nr:hypothetical protein [Deltaproteobacteria bacterium]
MLLPLATAPVDRIGGKAAALRRLLDKGLPVPESWVLPVDALDTVLAANKLRPDDVDLAARLAVATIPFPLVAPAPVMAVRSSALGEDGKEHSFAGQYTSVLGVLPCGLADAVRAVWASAVGAQAYRGAARIASMAVLVQRMVDARCAGVMFTIDPVSGSWREMVVEAAWGLGEGLVSGTIVPDRYRLRRPRQTPRPVQRVLARVRLERLHEDIATQGEETGVGAGGLVRRPVEAPHARKLAEPDLLALARLGLRAESLLGGPQDVEWAFDRGGRFVVLQSRPITTAARLPRGGATLWTRRFIGERFPRGTTPLGWSVLEPVLRHFIDYPETSARFLGGDPPLRVVRGHPYLNATVFRHLAFKWPGFPPPRFMLEFFPPDEVEAWVKRAAAPADLRVYRSILATTFREKRWQRFRWNPFTNHLAWRDFAGGLPSRLAGLDAASPTEAIATADPILRDYVKVHITSLLFANLWWQWTEGHLDEADRNLLLAPPGRSVTSRINAELATLTPGTLEPFLSRHGHRSDASWELFSARWVENPGTVLHLAELARARPLAEADDRAAEARMHSLGPGLRAAVGLARAYIALREEQRYELDRILWSLKRRLLLLGEAIFPGDPARIRFLERGELGLPRDELRATARAREADPPDPSPADFLRGDESVPVPRAGARLDGLGVSPGVSRGRVRVLRDPAEGHRLVAGEILVAPSTDPQWTPLFARAAGLVVELGSMLSHGAVVAREYRLPAVANVRGATKILRDGMEVTLDGRAGAVWVHDRDEAPP